MNKDKIIKDLKERNDKLKNQYQLQEIRLHSLEYENEKQKEVLDKIKEKCLSIKGNPEHTIVSKNELVKQFLDLLEEIE